MNQEKLSVIIPLYNTSRFLTKCLDSIVNQTYKNIEIIIVNDNSPDENDDIIAREYQNKDNRIVYIKHDVNKTQAGARNTALRIATGKYVAFVDADDFLLDLTAYEQAVNSFKQDTNIVCFGYDLYRITDGQYICEHKSDLSKFYSKIDQFNDNPKSYTHLIALWKNIFLLEDIRKNNIYFIENKKIEDLYFWFLYVIKVEPKLVFINKSFYGYVLRDDSDSVNYFNDIKYYREIYSYIKNFYYSLDENMQKKWRAFYIHNVSVTFLNISYVDKLNNPDKELESVNSLIDIVNFSEITADEIFKNNFMYMFQYCIADKNIRNLYHDSYTLYSKKMKRLRKKIKISLYILIPMIILNILLIIGILR